MLNQYKNVIIFAVGVAALYAGYSYFFGGAVQTTLQTTSIVEGAGGNIELVSLLQKIESITIDDAVFSDPVFRSLTDFAQTISIEPAGRIDPFAPIAGGRVAPPTVEQQKVNKVFTR